MNFQIYTDLLTRLVSAERASQASYDELCRVRNENYDLKDKIADLKKPAPPQYDSTLPSALNLLIAKGLIANKLRNQTIQQLRDQKIPLIKELRDTMSSNKQYMGLKDAKEAIEAALLMDLTIDIPF